jgi:hypothetical protein
MVLLVPFARSACGPPTPVAAPPAARPATRTQRLEIGRFVVHLLIGSGAVGPDPVSELEACVDERVVAWSPSACLTSRTALVAALCAADDSLAGVEVSITGEAITETTSFLEWRAAGRFTNACFVDDDVLLEASGAEISAAGVMALTFAGPRVSSIRCYYDARALDDQLLRR